MGMERGNSPAPFEEELLALYTEYVAEPDTKRDIYAYILLALGVLLGVGGLLADAVGALGVVIALFGIVLSLPVTQTWRRVAAGSATLGVATVGLSVVLAPGRLSDGAIVHSTVLTVLYVGSLCTLAGTIIALPLVTGRRSYVADPELREDSGGQVVPVNGAEEGGLYVLGKNGHGWNWQFVEHAAIAEGASPTPSRLEAQQRVAEMKSQVAGATLLDVDDTAFRLYESGEDGWRWYLMQGDGSAIAEGAIEYDSRTQANRAIDTLEEHSETAETYVVDGGFYRFETTGEDVTWEFVHQDRHVLAKGATTGDRETVETGRRRFQELAGGARELAIDTYGVELTEDGDRWGWRLRDNEYQHVASSTRDYETRDDAEAAVEDRLSQLFSAEILEQGQPTYDVYKAGDDWQWRLVDETGVSVASGNTDVTGRERAAEAATEFKQTAPEADVVNIETLEFETYETADGWRWRLLDGDRNVHARGPETYRDKRTAGEAVDRVRQAAPEADRLDFETAAFHIYEADGGAWHWRLIDDDGAEIADSGQGEYGSKDGAMQAMTTLQENAPEADHLEIDTAAFELFRDDDGHGWRLVDDVGDTIADGVTRHETQAGAKEAMETVLDAMTDVEKREMSSGVFHIYGDDEWWWEFVEPDGAVLAAASTNFETQRAVEDEVEQIQAAAGGAPVKKLGYLGILLDTDEWSWALVDEERDPVATSEEIYVTRQAAVSRIEDMKYAATDMTIYEIRTAAFDCYRSDDGWTWRLIDENHDEIARGTRTYEDRETVSSTLSFLGRVAPGAAVLEYDDLAFEIHHEQAGWTWRVIDEKQRILATASNHYETAGDVEEDIRDAKDAIDDAGVVEIDAATFEFHRRDDGWTWRLLDETGNKLAESNNVFSSRAAAEEELTTVMDIGPDAIVSRTG
jgi:uncharacterized protein YegP (UPF0339 family)